MIAELKIGTTIYKINFSEPIDISIPLRQGESVNAFHIPYAKFEPIRVGSFVGSVAEGGSANCENLFINAHGNGTHTECVGHISKERITINQCLKNFMFEAELISITPEQTENGDLVISQKQIEEKLKSKTCEALIIRTLPNSDDKLFKKYSGNNPSYLHHTATRFIREKNIKHLLLDLPSVDREEDNGELLAHHSFWNYPEQPRLDMTITEMIYVSDEIADGKYLLNIQITSMESDASPSKPILYKLLGY
jgi:arylformamidase